MHRFVLIAACCLSTAAPYAASAAEPEPAAPRAQAEVVVEKVRLEYGDPEWLLRLLFFPKPPTAKELPLSAGLGGQGNPAAPPAPGRVPAQRSLVPDGVEGLLAYPLDNSLLVRGTAAAIRQFRSIALLLDVPRKTADDRQSLTLTLQNARPELVHNILLELPEEGKTEIDGKTLKLEGSPAWLHRALRVVVRLETAPAR